MRSIFQIPFPRTQERGLSHSVPLTIRGVDPGTGLAIRSEPPDRAPQQQSGPSDVVPDMILNAQSMVAERNTEVVED